MDTASNSSSTSRPGGGSSRRARPGPPGPPSPPRLWPPHENAKVHIDHGTVESVEKHADGNTFALVRFQAPDYAPAPYKKYPTEARYCASRKTNRNHEWALRGEDLWKDMEVHFDVSWSVNKFGQTKWWANDMLPLGFRPPPTSSGKALAEVPAANSNSSGPCGGSGRFPDWARNNDKAGGGGQQKQQKPISVTDVTSKDRWAARDEGGAGSRQKAAGQFRSLYAAGDNHRGRGGTGSASGDASVAPRLEERMYNKVSVKYCGHNVHGTMSFQFKVCGVSDTVNIKRGELVAVKTTKKDGRGDADKPEMQEKRLGYSLHGYFSLDDSVLVDLELRKEGKIQQWRVVSLYLDSNMEKKNEEQVAKADSDEDFFKKLLTDHVNKALPLPEADRQVSGGKKGKGSKSKKKSGGKGEEDGVDVNGNVIGKDSKPEDLGDEEKTKEEADGSEEKNSSSSTASTIKTTSDDNAAEAYLPGRQEEEKGGDSDDGGDDVIVEKVEFVQKQEQEKDGEQQVGTVDTSKEAASPEDALAVDKDRTADDEASIPIVDADDDAVSPADPTPGQEPAHSTAEAAPGKIVENEALAPDTEVALVPAHEEIVSATAAEAEEKGPALVDAEEKGPALVDAEEKGPALVDAEEKGPALVDAEVQTDETGPPPSAAVNTVSASSSKLDSHQALLEFVLDFVGFAAEAKDKILNDYVLANGGNSK